MRIILSIFIIILIISCGYPDIYSVPNFDDIKLSDEEALDLCKISNADKKEIDKCINELEYN